MSNSQSWWRRARAKGSAEDRERRRKAAAKRSRDRTAAQVRQSYRPPPTTA